MQDTDALLRSALRRYVTMAIRAHPEGQQLERAYSRGELAFRIEYDGVTQIVRVSGVNRAGHTLVISERTLGT